MSGISGHKTQPGDERGTMSYRDNLIENLDAALSDLCNHADSELTMEEKYENIEVPWLTIFNRMGQETVDRIMDEIGMAHAALTNYDNPDDDYPPGIPRN